MRQAAPVIYLAPVYYEPIAVAESYSWRAGADSDQVHLYQGSRCIGGYRYSTDNYFAHSFFSGISTYSATPCEPPIEPPYRDGARRWVTVENEQPTTEDPFRIEQSLDYCAIHEDEEHEDRDGRQEVAKKPAPKKPDPRSNDLDLQREFTFEDVPPAAWIGGAAGLLLLVYCRPQAFFE
jgi:hypothetical protein